MAKVADPGGPVHHPDLDQPQRKLVRQRCRQSSLRSTFGLLIELTPGCQMAISKKFGISEQAARVPQLTFLCAYAFGCMSRDQQLEERSLMSLVTVIR